MSCFVRGLVIVSAFLLSFAVHAIPTGVRYVAIDATGTADGSSWADAYTSIYDAVDDLNSNGGGVIYVAAGQYDVTDTDGSIVFETPISLIGAGPGVTMILHDKNTGPAIKILHNSNGDASGSLISSLKIKAADLEDLDIGGIYIRGAADVTLDNVWIHGFGGHDNVTTFVSPDNSDGGASAYGLKLEKDGSNFTKNIRINQSQLWVCHNGIVALEGSSLQLDSTIIRDTTKGAALYVKSGTSTNTSTVTVSSSWFAQKGDATASAQISEYLVYLQGPSSGSANTNHLFINSETELDVNTESDDATFANHIYIGAGANGNQIISHTFMSGARPGLSPGSGPDDCDPGTPPYAVYMASDGSRVGQYQAISEECGTPLVYATGSNNKIWKAY